MTDLRERLLGSFIIVFLGLAVSAQSPSRWIDEKNQIRNDEEVKESGRELFRVYRGDHFYVTDYRGADLLRNGINEGYRQGFITGVKDYASRSYVGHRSSETFKAASIGYKKFIDLDEYQYYFRRGFELGYYDGFDGMARYGNISEGARNLNENVMAGILDIRAN